MLEQKKSERICQRWYYNEFFERQSIEHLVFPGLGSGFGELGCN